VAAEPAFRAALKAEAAGLAARLPALVIEARMTARSVRHGVHGRRRAGPGENFWQFRPFMSGEPAQSVDWRRSARETRAYVREREWEAAQTLHIWIDRSHSMDFASPLAAASKRERAIVLALALADLAVQGGERVALIGLTQPIAAHDVIERFALALGQAGESVEDVPPTAPIGARAKVALFGDFLAEPQRLDAAFRALASDGAGGVASMIADPIEENFPFRGAVDFLGKRDDARLRSLNAEGLREAYLKRLGAQRESVAATCKALGWSFLPHRTDAAPASALLALTMRLSASGPR